MLRIFVFEFFRILVMDSYKKAFLWSSLQSLYSAYVLIYSRKQIFTSIVEKLLIVTLMSFFNNVKYFYLIRYQRDIHLFTTIFLSELFLMYSSTILFHFVPSLFKYIFRFFERNKFIVKYIGSLIRAQKFYISLYLLSISPKYLIIISIFTALSNELILKFFEYFLKNAAQVYYLSVSFLFRNTLLLAVTFRILRSNARKELSQSMFYYGCFVVHILSFIL